jgi:hypothetical protein
MLIRRPASAVCGDKNFFGKKKDEACGKISSLVSKLARNYRDRETRAK